MRHINLPTRTLAVPLLVILSNCSPFPVSIEGYQLARDSETYGRIERLDVKNQGRTLDPGVGLAALRCHYEELDFITNFVYEMLPGISPRYINTFTGETNPEPIPLFNESETSLRSLSIRAAYRVPENLDFGRHLSLLEAARFSCQNGLRLLRNDPNVFWSTLKDYSEHEISHVRIDGPGSATNPNDSWARQITRMVADRYANLVYIEAAYDRASILAKLVERDGGNFASRAILPDNMMEALIKYVCVLSHCISSLKDRFNRSVQDSPGFRHGYVRFPDSEGGSKTEFRGNGQNDDPLWDLLRELDDPDLLVGCEVSARDVVDAIESHFEGDPQSANRLSSTTLQMLGDLGLMSFLKRDTKSFEPWASNMTFGWQKHGAKVNLTWSEQEARIVRFQRALAEISLPGSWEPLFCQYERPDVIYTEEETNLAIKAENCLDEAWQAIEQTIFSCFGKSLADLFEKDLPPSAMLYRTPAWVAPLPSTTLSIIQSQDDSRHTSQEESVHPNQEEIFKDAVETSTNSRKQTILRPAKMNAKAAREAKKLTMKAKKPPTSKAPAAQTHAEKMMFHVSARSLEVFHTIFFVPGRRGFKDVNFKDFRYAMVEIGFNVCYIAGGSAVSLTPDPQRTKLEYGIIVHAPHGQDPPNALPHKVARKEWGYPLTARWARTLC